MYKGSHLGTRYIFDKGQGVKTRHLRHCTHCTCIFRFSQRPPTIRAFGMLSASLQVRRRVISHLVTVRNRTNSQLLWHNNSAHLHNTARSRTFATRAVRVLPRTNSPLSRRHLSSTTPTKQGEKDVKMASDDDYMNFLNKANEDPSAGSAQTTAKDSGKKELKATDHGAEIPQPLVKATEDAFYVSDADEPFVPVSLAWEKGEGLPDEGRLSHFFAARTPRHSGCLAGPRAFPNNIL